MLLSDVEVRTNGVRLPFDERMNMNMRKYERLGI
jgi:hypothetical protein